jgi:tetratricopeptide (TPR) repeat protein
LQRRVYGLALERCGWFLRQLGQPEAARAALEEALAILQDDPEHAALCHISLGALFASTGDFAAANTRFTLAIARAQHALHLANALSGLGNVCRAMGELAEAREHYERALALAEESGNLQIAATVLCNLGTALYYLEARSEAEAATRRSHALAERLGDAPLVAVCLANLAEMVFVKGDHAEASRIRLQSLALRQDLGDREGEAFDTLMLGYDACRQGKLEEARRWFLAGLELAHAITALPLVLDALVGLGEVGLKTGEPDLAARYLSVVLAHPATPAEVKERAREVAASCPPVPEPPHLDDVLAQLLPAS